MSLAIGDRLELSIDSLSYGGGRGVGRYQGQVLFVPYSAPGDRLVVEVLSLKKSFGEARLIEIVEPSPYRRPPVCPVYGQCGGCSLQHVDYQEQLKQKNLYIQRALRHLSIETLHPIEACSNPYFYRNRIQVHIQESGFGFLKAKSNQLVEIQGCPIAEEPIHQFLGQKNLLSMLRLCGEKKIEIFMDQDKSVCTRKLHEEPEKSQFSQVNRFQNQKLIEMVNGWTQKALSRQSIEWIYDLYCGDGNLAFPLFEVAQRPVLGVELSQSAVERARLRVPVGMDLSFRAESVDRFLRAQKDLSQVLVVSDPPRVGLTERVTSELRRLMPSTIIHIGCDLMSFANDLQRLTHKGSYKILEVQPLDMFPQTDHVELGAWLEKA